MKKGICFICCVFMLCTDTTRTNALGIMPQNSYTEEGLNYPVFDLKQDVTVCTGENNRDVNICVVFNGIVVLPKTKFYTTIFSGEIYLGILNFQNAIYKDGKIHAYYSGTLTLQK